MNYLETTSTSNSWAKDSTTDYSGVVVSYIVKVIGMLILLCVDIGFNSSVDHDDPMPIGGSDSLRLTFGMIYFGSQVGAYVPMLFCVCTRWGRRWLEQEAKA